MVEHSEDAAAVVSRDWEGEDAAEGVSFTEVAVGDSENSVEGTLVAVDVQDAVGVEDSENAEAVVSEDWEGDDVVEGISDTEVGVGDSEGVSFTEVAVGDSGTSFSLSLNSCQSASNVRSNSSFSFTLAAKALKR